MDITYKVLGEKGQAHHGGSGSWPLANGRPGKWLIVKGELIPCVHGLHLCRKQDLIQWLGPTIWLAEYRGEPVVAEDKIVVAKARLLKRLDTWNETIARLFAADCAARAVRQCRKRGLTIDGRVDECIRVSRRYARGGATEVERLAAMSAAGSAAGESAAASAAWWAAASAAWSSAGSAAESAAESAEREWQTKRLFEYLDGKRS